MLTLTGLDSTKQHQTGQDWLQVYMKSATGGWLETNIIIKECQL